MEYQGKFTHNVVRKVRWANYPFVPGIREPVFGDWGREAPGCVGQDLHSVPLRELRPRILGVYGQWHLSGTR